MSYFLEKLQSNGERKIRERKEMYVKCGLCLEVCPNYEDGKRFYGAAFANDCYLVASRNHQKAGEIRAAYGEHFGRDCSKALFCMDVCPMKIPTIASMAKLNHRKMK